MTNYALDSQFLHVRQCIYKLHRFINGLACFRPQRTVDAYTSQGITDPLVLAALRQERLLALPHSRRTCARQSAVGPDSCSREMPSTPPAARNQSSTSPLFEIKVLLKSPTTMAAANNLSRSVPSVNRHCALDGSGLCGQQHGSVSWTLVPTQTATNVRLSMARGISNTPRMDTRYYPLLARHHVIPPRCT